MDWMFHDYNPVTNITTHVKVEDGDVIYRRSQPVDYLLDTATALRNDELAWAAGKDRALGINTALVPLVIYEQWWHEFRGQDPRTMKTPAPKNFDVGMKHPEFAAFVQSKLQSREFRRFMTTAKSPYPLRNPGQVISDGGAKPRHR